MAANVVVPAILTRLKTHPGGHRGLRRFDPRVRALWRILVTSADAGFTLILNKSAVAALLGVHRNTVGRWLSFFERHHLVTTHGQRGSQGLYVTVTWLVRGQALAARRQRAQELSKTDHCKPHTQATSRRRCTTDDTRLTPYGDFIANRARAMKAARTALAARIQDPSVATEAISACGKWLWKENPSPEEFQRFFRGISEARRVPVPRWVKTAQDVHRWMRSLITKLVRYGAAWWSRLQRVVERRRLERTLARIKSAVEAGKPCPICQRIHDQADWREGRDRRGKLACPGWARVRLEQLQPQPQERPRREDTNEDLRRRWQDERHEFQTPLWHYDDFRPRKSPAASNPHGIGTQEMAHFFSGGDPATEMRAS